MTFGEKRFNKKLDKIRRLEESGVLAKKKKKNADDRENYVSCANFDTDFISETVA